MTPLISRGQVPISRYITSICNYQQVYPTMRKVVPYLTFSSSYSWYHDISSEIQNQTYLVYILYLSILGHIVYAEDILCCHYTYSVYTRDILLSILGFVTLYSGFTLLSPYMWYIYQGFTIIYFRICKPYKS